MSFHSETGILLWKVICKPDYISKPLGNLNINVWVLAELLNTATLGAKNLYLKSFHGDLKAGSLLAGVNHFG